MQKAYQKKTFDVKALDVDTTTKSVKVAIAHIGNKDRDGDVFTTEAFTKTIKECGPQGSNEIWHLVDHVPSIKSALGKFKELYQEGDYVVGISQYKDTTLWNDVFKLYESGDITQHSVGFSIIKEAKNDAAGYNEIREVKLWEGSSVLWGANPMTPTLGVTKSATKEEISDEISKRFNKIRKGLKNDIETSLLIIELKQLEQLYIEVVTKEATQAATIAPEPESVDLIKELQGLITNNFKIK